MRKGYDPLLVFNKKNHLVAIATGADACTEHEIGISRLMEKLGATPVSFYDLEKEVSAVQQARTLNQPDPYPDLAERLCIKNAHNVHFDQTEAEAVLWTSFGGPYDCSGTIQGLLQDSEFQYPTPYPDDRFLPNKDLNIAAMWDERSFAIRVKSPRYIRGLSEFYNALKDGRAMFGGRFFYAKDYRLSGVILVNTQYLRGENLKALKKLQDQYEKAIRLACLSEEKALVQQLVKVWGPQRYAQLVRRLEPVWVNSTDETKGVLYNVSTTQAGETLGLSHKNYSFAELVAFAAKHP